MFSSGRPLLAIIAFLALSCSAKPYRATLGVSAVSSDFASENKDREERELEVSGNPERFAFDPWVEFKPKYFKESKFGWASFISRSKVQASLKDYPPGTETEVEVERIALNPVVFYNFGDRLFTEGKGLAFRIGIGLSLNYITNFQLENRITGEKFQHEAPFRPGWSSFLEFSWNWLVIRAETSEVEYGGKKFEEVEEDYLVIDTSKISFLYAYYF